MSVPQYRTVGDSTIWKVEALNRGYNEKSQEKKRLDIAVCFPPVILGAADPRNIGAITNNSRKSSAVYVLSKVAKAIAGYIV